MGVLQSSSTSSLTVQLYLQSYSPALPPVLQSRWSPRMPADPAITKLIALISALFLPPLSVFLMRGIGSDLVINILLTLAFAIPGMIHAFWIVLKADGSGSILNQI